MTENLKQDTKFSRIAGNLIYESIKDKKYNQALKAIEVKLKIDHQLKKSQQHLQHLSIFDVPVEILERWLGELEYEAAKKPSCI